MNLDYLEDYKLCDDTFKGRGGYKDGEYLYYLTSELNDQEKGQEKYYNRLKQAPFPNYLKDAVLSFVSHIFKKNIQREYTTQNDLISTLLKNIDRKNNNINVFMQNISKSIKSTGVTFILVDMPTVTSNNFQEQINNKELPYFVEYSPLSVFDYKLDNLNSLEWIIFKEVVEEKKPFDITSTKKMQYRYYDREIWEIRDEHKKVIANDYHNLGKCPVVMISENSDFPNRPDFFEIALLNKVIYNYTSLSGQQLRDQQLNLLTFHLTEEIMQRLQSTESIAPVKMQTDNSLAFTGNVRPDFISPSADPVKLIREEIASFESRIDRVANYIQTGFSAESGIALENKFEGLNAKLREFANRLENAEMQLFDIVARWLKLNLDISVSYPDDFNITDTKELIENFMLMKDYINSKIFNTEIRKKIASEILPNLEEAKKDEMLSEIDEIYFES